MQTQNFQELWDYITELSQIGTGLRLCLACKLIINGSCQRFMHVGRRQEDCRLETKDLIAHFIQSWWTSFSWCFLLSSKSLGVMWSDSLDVHTVGCVTDKDPQSLIMGLSKMPQRVALFLFYFIFYIILIYKPVFWFAWTLSLPSKMSHYISNFEKIVQNKSCQCLCWSEMHKHQRSIENCLSKEMWHLSRKDDTFLFNI